MPLYDFASNQIPVTGSTIWTKLIGARSNRVTLSIMIKGTGGVAHVHSLSLMNKSDKTFYISNPPMSLVMAYRDWGPVISQEIWFTSTDGTAVASVTEVFMVPNT